MTTSKRNGWIGLAAMVVLGIGCVWGSDPLYRAIDKMMPKAEPKTALADGTYQWEDSQFDDSGFKNVVTVTVTDGRIETVSWDCVNADGAGKKELSEAGSYIMTESGPLWSEQSASLAEYVIENQTTEGLMNAEGKCDAISSVSIHINGFVSAVEECLKQAEAVN